MRYITFIITLLFITLINQNAFTIEKDTIAAKSIFKLKNTRNYSNKGRIYVHWGYNFSWYGKSNLRLYGPGYDVTLKNIAATDRPSKLSLDYINPLKLTIPQFNFRFGYFIKDNYSISIGWDHMKYVVQIPQTVKATGYINSEISSPGIPTGRYEGVYNNTDLTINQDMLLFEHTDGYNFASIDIERYDDAWVSKSKKQSLNIETGVSVGLVVPRTDARLFGVGDNHFWNVAGYGAAAKLGARFFFTPKFYFQANVKGGWTNLTRIHTTGRNNIDNAKQQITFLENYYLLGYLF